MALIENLSNDDDDSEKVAKKKICLPSNFAASIWTHLIFQM